MALLYRKNPLLSIVFFALLSFFICFFLLEFSVIFCASNSGFDAVNVKKVDGAVILGHALDDSGEAPGEWLTGRLQLGLELYNRGAFEKIIVTGGMGKTDEAPVAHYMAEWLINNGVSENDIIIEDKASNTDENFYYSVDLAKQNGIETIVVVTDDFHLFRSIETAKIYFTDVTAVGADPPFGFKKVLAYIKEPFSYIKHLFFNKPINY